MKSGEPATLMSIVGARPQFVKASIMSEALRASGCREYLVHTGQHYDSQMSGIFFDDLGIPQPIANLGVGSGPHGAQTGRMLMQLEETMLQLSPELVIVYGDTNSTLAGALAAVKLHIPVAHIEAGARNFSLTIPEEVNRILTDRLSVLRFCATRTHVRNLRNEGMHDGILTGDVMLDVFRKHEKLANQRYELLSRLGIEKTNYVLATFHRPSNIDNAKNLEQILKGLVSCGYTVVFPVHPRTHQAISVFPELKEILKDDHIKLIEPLGYLDFVCLELYSRCIVTDSGGVQREAYFASKPCITVFQNTSWPETVEEGWNRLVSPKSDSIAQAIQTCKSPQSLGNAFGYGTAAKMISEIIKKKIESGITVDG